MRTKANAIFEMTRWSESPYNEVTGLPKLTHVSAEKSFRGDIQGESVLQYLMMYREDGTASFVGLERIVGRLGARAGSFVLQHTGIFEGGVAKVHYVVVSGSGTGELRGLCGEGNFASAHAQQYPLILNYDFE